MIQYYKTQIDRNLKLIFMFLDSVKKEDMRKFKYANSRKNRKTS
jgi:hypothetical protein